jgi:hypothetical protein
MFCVQHGQPENQEQLATKSAHDVWQTQKTVTE